MTKYMHTIEGLPAQFYPGQGICFNSKRVRLVGSLRQLRREQEISARLDIEIPRQQLRYGYVTVTV